jgi:selenide,water dikinase
MAVALTSLSHGAGCGCKLPAADIHALVRGLPRSDDPNVLVGFDGADDAAVYRLSDEVALVTTVDFFTPIVDDPYLFGRIAATNALSDVYAMGGRPVTALNLVAFPLERLGAEVLREVLRGGQDAAAEAGCAVVGGHSIDDAEPKYGMAVTGFAHPDRIWRNTGGRPGDVLVFSKRIGTGIVATAIKRGEGKPEVVDAAVESMTTLNDRAARELAEARPHAVTDVTGFGLVGHARELAAGAGLRARLRLDAVPVLPGVRHLVEAGVVPGGTRTNLELAEAYATFGEGLSEVDRLIACDAQTSGGLLAAVPADAAERLGWAVVGELADGPAGTVLVD